ncbi:50S ribosomal protein L35 [Neoconidiobolus thromboides FSU 785]|nr:50S ribosomal protein L35 [Neoconidiobolus thromboides FSU 785]
MGYKLKTHKGAAKRFRKTSTGHKRGQAGKQHLNFGMSGERRGRLRGTVEVTSTQSKLLDRMQIR